MECGPNYIILGHYNVHCGNMRWTRRLFKCFVCMKKTWIHIVFLSLGDVCRANRGEMAKSLSSSSVGPVHHSKHPSLSWLSFQTEVRSSLRSPTLRLGLLSQLIGTMTTRTTDIHSVNGWEWRLAEKSFLIPVWRCAFVFVYFVFTMVINSRMVRCDIKRKKPD